MADIDHILVLFIGECSQQQPSLVLVHLYELSDRLDVPFLRVEVSQVVLCDVRKHQER